MKLSDAARGRRVKILKITAEPALIARMSGLGLERGGYAVAVRDAPFRAGVLVMTAAGYAVLRENLARAIEVTYE